MPRILTRPGHRGMPYQVAASGPSDLVQRVVIGPRRDVRLHALAAPKRKGRKPPIPVAGDSQPSCPRADIPRVSEESITS